MPHACRSCGDVRAGAHCGGHLGFRAEQARRLRYPPRHRRARQADRSQESPLNNYRCRFGVDAHAVLGGCVDGRPSLEPSVPSTFAGNPIQQDIAVRDELVAAQESLLNVYRCRFNIDTQVVPDGCTSQPTQPEAAQPPAIPFVDIASGSSHSCGSRADGAVACWGFNNYGQADAPGGRFVAIAAGTWHSCGIRTNGNAHCWGNSDWGQADPPGGRFIAISTGSWHSCGIKAGGAIACWGSSYRGQTDALSGTYIAVSSGDGHSCGIRTGGAIQCWGDNRWGQTDAPQGTFTAIAAGHWLSCGIRTVGTIACWGNNEHARQTRP